MASFVVMEPTGRQAGEETVFIRDGFHFFAFLIPFLWFFWHRLWIEGLIALAVAFVLGAVGTAAGFGGAAPFLSLLVSIYVGLEGAALRLAALRRRGWHEWGVVEAENRSDAETRYFGETFGGADAPSEVLAPSVPTPVGRAHRPGPSLGLFTYPGRR